GATLTGRGEAGATVRVSGPDGAPLGEALVDANGFFTLTLNPALGNAERLSLTQTDLAGNVSAPATLDTPDFTPPAQLTAVTISTDGSMIAGRGEAGATVTVTDANGTLLGTTKVLADGSFEVMLTPAQINQQVLAVQQADPPGNVSQPVSVEAPDLTPPAAPVQLQLNADGSDLSGVGEPGSTARVYLGSTEIGTVQVGDDGRFVVALSPSQNNGQQLQVTLEDAKGNLSPSTPATAPDTTPPSAVNATINASGTQLNGTGEAGARLTVLNDKGDLVGQGNIGADGSFVLNLSPAQLNGQVLSIVAQDATGNPSPAFAVTAPDLTPPAQPTGLSVSADGTLLSGTGEVGSFITVRAPDNTVVGTIEVPAGGSFNVAL
ncbi:Ig-like domain-containing protein, partial [Pseudomonas shirazensis]